MRKFLVLIVLFLSINEIKSQDLVQFSGVVVTGDSLNPVPFTSIMIANTYRGTTADYFGYFSFVAMENDTVVFSSVGYRKAQFIVPGNLEENKYSLIQILQADTIELPEAVIYPWPSKEQFKEAFLALEVPLNDVERGKRNLRPEEMALRMAELGNDGAENFKFQMQQDASRLYYAGQAPPINVFNPVAWSAFLDAWRRGDFKKKK